MDDLVRRPLTRRYDVPTELSEGSVWHQCGGKLERSYDPALVICPCCCTTWKLSTIERFTDAQLSERFYVLGQAPAQAQFVLAWVTEGGKRFLKLATPHAAEALELEVFRVG